MKKNKTNYWRLCLLKEFIRKLYIIVYRVTQHHWLLWMLKGFILGLSALVPGLSAGTLAVAMNIYQKIIFSITNIFSIKQKNHRWPDYMFLLCLFTGSLLAVLAGSQWIPFLLKSFPLEIYSLFIGFILACLPMLFHRLALSVAAKNLKNTLISLSCVITTAVLTVVITTTAAALGTNLADMNHPSMLWLFCAGFLSAFSAVLPGFSGSLVLLLMGLYEFILEALAERDWLSVFFFLLGCAPGLISSLYCMRYFIKKYYRITFSVLSGLVLASVVIVFPWGEWQKADWLFGSIKLCVFCSIGFFLLFFLEKYTKKIQWKD